MIKWKIEEWLKFTRLKRFCGRFKNQYRIHKNHFSVWMILKIAWIQSKQKPLTNECEKHEVVVIKLEE